METDGARTARGALAGALAAAVWAAQQPLDRRVFGCGFSDVELLGKAITRGRAWPAVGLALHLQNGALFGAAYATVAPRVPIAPWLRGPLAGLGEHLATWPLARLSDRLHPARDDLPRLTGNRRAFWQATWRHAVFAVVLGEVERRLNPPAPPAPPAPSVPTAEVAASNGHGNLEHALAADGR